MQQVVDTSTPSTYYTLKLAKVLEALNNTTPVFTKKHCGERIVWVLARSCGVVPIIPSTEQIAQQGWMETGSDRTLVHYIEGFGWIPEEDIFVSFREFLLSIT